MTKGADFSDLTARVLSAIVMVLIAGIAVWQGGVYFNTLLVVIGGLMAWELSRMHGAKEPIQYISAIGVAAVVFMALFMTPLQNVVFLLITLITSAVLGFLHKNNQLTLFIGFFVFILATTALGDLRSHTGLVLTLWLIGCVIASDVGGYFAGKIIGGRKLWPRVSPKKTWSGTIGGWALAVCVGVILVLVTDAPIFMIFASVCIAIAAQTGDLIESAIKRRAGVKDSSNLIPGHGGLLDRFDGILGACMVLFFLDVFGLI